MQGVVIWYSRSDFQAIVWCEDSKDLGIVSGPTCWRNPMVTVEVGDYVGFRAEAGEAGRRCRDVHLIEPVAAPTLAESLLDTARKAVHRTKNPLLHLCARHD